MMGAGHLPTTNWPKQGEPDFGGALHRPFQPQLPYYRPSFDALFVTSFQPKTNLALGSL